ncbi:MAG: dihydrofolate reductase [Bacteroidota bacterium]|nr:dihydrofolate reductase [Bacteroidota bacterium]
MQKSIIVAKAENNVIGKDNDLIWHMPNDMKHFRSTTMGHYIIMGRKTFEATKKPLPGRTSIVITRNKDYKAEGCIVVNNILEAFKLGEENKQEEVFILGGGEIYKQAMDLADKIYLTEIKEEFEGDTYFPEIDSNKWKEIKREEFQSDEKNPHPYAFVELIKR